MRPLRFGSINIDGIENKIDSVIDLMIENQFHFIACQETWLKPDQKISKFDNLFVCDLRMPVTLLPGDYPHRHTGGLLVIRNPQLTSAHDFQLIKKDESFNYMWFTFREKYTCGVFYLKPDLNQLSVKQALHSIKKYCSPRNPNCNTIVMGDFNIWLGN
jgi:exonuclease III